MKLYYGPAGAAAEGWWQVPGQQNRKAKRIEVPTSTRELCDFLNAHNVRVDFGPESLAEAPLTLSPDLGPPKYPDPAETRSTAFKTDEIEAFILDRASVAECERIFATLGTRFAELVRGKP